VAVFRIAVQEEHRLAFSGDQIMKSYCVNDRETIFDTDPFLCGNARCQRENEYRRAAEQRTQESFHRSLCY